MSDHYDWIVIGAGPGGQKAALCAAGAGAKVAVVERDAQPGGACVHRGTIPSKTLREAAVQLSRFFRQAERFGLVLPSEVRFSHVRGQLDQVIARHVGSIRDELALAGVDRIHGSARFVSPHELEVRSPSGASRRLTAKHIVVATGSRPRNPPETPVDHDLVLDSDSVLGLEYLPHSLVIIGGGIIACEYAAIFASLGVLVTIIDRAPRPLAFLDPELSEGFLRAFEAAGGVYLGDRKVRGLDPDGLAAVTTYTDGGEAVTSEKVMVALGRVPSTASLGLAEAGIAVDTHGRIPVDANGRTVAGHVYAVGDVIGPPALASYSMEQGRRAVMHALGLETGEAPSLVPMGIFTIPELAAVGETERSARERFGEVTIGRADFAGIARGHIAGEPDGFLKLVADAEGERLLGVGIVGEGATELVHLGLLLLRSGGRVRELVEGVFNFPTMAEAYRVAALDLLARARTGVRRRAA
ncbi:MAG: Si-specific NAD(P)(+) transhydrogenase [Nannocystaceae bacterium]